MLLLSFSNGLSSLTVEEGFIRPSIYGTVAHTIMYSAMAEYAAKAPKVLKTAMGAKIIEANPMHSVSEVKRLGDRISSITITRPFSLSSAMSLRCRQYLLNM